MLGLIKGVGKYCCCSTKKGTANVWKNVSWEAHILEGANNVANKDLVAFNNVWEQCCIKGKITYQEIHTKKWTESTIGSDLVLDEFTSSTPTAEETALTKGQKKGVIYVYYVKGLSQGSLGEAFTTRFKSPPNPSIVVSNSKSSKTFPHEFGHILGLGHGTNTDPKKLMSQTGVGLGENLSESECDDARKSPHVK